MIHFGLSSILHPILLLLCIASSELALWPLNAHISKIRSCRGESTRNPYLKIFPWFSGISGSSESFTLNLLETCFTNLSLRIFMFLDCRVTQFELKLINDLGSAFSVSVLPSWLNGLVFILLLGLILCKFIEPLNIC